MADLPSRLENLHLSYTAESDDRENPVTWVERYMVRSSQLEKDVLFDNLDMKNVTQTQYGRDRPEYIKWKLFGYNLVICFEYVTKGEADKALTVVGDMENILISIDDNDSFLKSIKVALDHITFSMKGHVLKLCSMETELVAPFIMINEMNHIEKAALFGVQTIFFYEYDLPCAKIAKDCALKAISLNEHEAEWHYLLAKVLTHWQKSCGNFYECSKQEIDAAENAVKLGRNDYYKLHLAHIYQRMGRNACVSNNVEMKNLIFKTGLQLLNEVIKNSSNDVFLLKSCLLGLSKLSLDNSSVDSGVHDVLENLIDMLKLSNNGYVHGAIGNHYLFNKKDIIKANFHLKIAYEAKSFGNSFDYIYTLYRMNRDSTQIEPLLVDMLQNFHHPVHQEKILSQIVSYLMLTKNDVIQAVEYVPQLLSLKHVTCLYSLQVHRCKYSTSLLSPINLIDTLQEKLDGALEDSTLSADHRKKLTRVLLLLEPYKQFVGCLMEKKKHIFGKNLKKDIPAKKDKPHGRYNNHKESWSYKNPIQNTGRVERVVVNEGNWRSLKPDSVINPNIFSRNFKKQTTANGMEIKSRLNSQK